MISDGYRTLFLIALVTVFLSGCTKDENPDLSNNEMLYVAGINEVLPANLAEGVEVNPVVCAIFKSGTDASVLSGSILTLKRGRSLFQERQRFQAPQQSLYRRMI